MTLLLIPSWFACAASIMALMLLIERVSLRCPLRLLPETASLFSLCLSLTLVGTRALFAL